MKYARFGPAGNSDSFYAAGHKRSAEAPRWLAERGLGAYEYQCGNGVNLGDATGREIGDAAGAHGVAVSLHAPYYISLTNREKVEKNIDYVLRSCRAARLLGGTRVTVHSGSVMKRPRADALRDAEETLRDIARAMDAAGCGEMILCIETMGKHGQLGDMDEVLALCAVDERFLPCVDFGHLYARSQGALDGYDAWAPLFDRMESALGADRARRFHAHFSKIEYSAGGEKRHLTFADPGFGPDFRPVARHVVLRGYAPTFICESRGTQAEDAMQMQRVYREELERHG